jgi:membrane protein DedA with SNARE-associated domain
VGYFVGKSGAHLLSQIGIAGAAVLVISAVAAVVWLRRRERRAAARDFEER